MSEGSSLEELKGKLYSKKIAESSAPKDIRFKPYSGKSKIEQGWPISESVPKTVESLSMLKPKESSTKLRKIILLVVAVLLLAVTSVAFFFWIRGGGVISSKNLEVKIGGPVSAVAGDPVSLYLEIKNKGGINIASADLILEYPPGFRLKNNPSIELTRDRKPLGQIGAGQSVNQILELVIFGEGGSNKTIKASVEYRLEGSSAILVGESSYGVTLSQSPVDITLNFPSEIKTKQQIDFEVGLTSNSQSLIKDLYLQIDYPPGFNFVSAKPDAFKNNIWKIGDLMQGKSKKIILTGTVEGQEMEEKVFNVSVGTLTQDKLSNIYNSTSKSIVLRKPSFNVTVLVNNKDLEKNPVSSGERIYGELVWENSLPVEVRGSNVKVKITGNAVDQASVSAENGFYKTSEGALVWSQSSEPGLAVIPPGGSGSVKFGFVIKKPLPVSAAGDKNFIVGIDASMVGRKTEVGAENAEVRADVSKSLVVNSDLQFAVRGLHYSGPFTDSGPMPPKIGQETAYTVIWSLVNYSNEITNTKVSAILPPYMRWMGNVAPVGASVSFDASTGLITWDKGSVRAGAGILSPAEEVAFQIGLMPAPNQAGTSPDILLASQISGTDSFTDGQISYSKPALNTNLDDDSRFKYGEGEVIK